MRSRVKEAMLSRRVTARRLASELGVHEVTVSRWCSDKGIEGVTLKRLADVAARLGCPAKELFEEEEEGQCAG